MNRQINNGACYWDAQAKEKSKNLSKPTYEIRIEQDRPIVMKDDVRLYCDVYRPDDNNRHPERLPRPPEEKEIRFSSENSCMNKELKSEASIILQREATSLLSSIRAVS